MYLKYSYQNIESLLFIGSIKYVFYIWLIRNPLKMFSDSVEIATVALYVPVNYEKHILVIPLVHNFINEQILSRLCFLSRKNVRCVL